MTCGSTLSGPALEDQHGPTSAPNVRLWTRLMAWDMRISALMHAVEREVQTARAFCCPSGLVCGPLGSGHSGVHLAVPGGEVSGRLPLDVGRGGGWPDPGPASVLLPGSAYQYALFVIVNPSIRAYHLLC